MPAPRRRWFRFAFSLRTLFVVMTLFGVWMGWQVRIVRERKEALEALEVIHPEVVMYNPYRTIPIWRKWLGDKSIYCLSLSLGLPPVSRSHQSAERLQSTFPEAIIVLFRGHEEEAFLLHDGLKPLDGPGSEEGRRLFLERLREITDPSELDTLPVAKYP